MTRMTGPDFAVMHNLMNTHTHRHTHTQAGGVHEVLRAQVRVAQVERVCPLCRV